MVDKSTSTDNLSAHDIVTHLDRTQIDSATKTWMSNIDAAIKLRQKGATMLSKLPSGVFRYMLDYQFPNELRYRYSEHYGPLRHNRQIRDFPEIDKLDYNNYLVAVDERSPADF